MLSDSIGLDLEFEETQKEKIGKFEIGRYKADIICRYQGYQGNQDHERNGFVVIENQFKETNHDHLGKLLTYAAHLRAKENKPGALIWIAQKFTVEHRTTLDILNEEMDSIALFGVEIQIVQIGDKSPLAPLFKVVARPGRWKGEIGAHEIARKILEGFQ